jgi:hypothetical protein
MDPQINLDGTILHKPCAKCADCSCQITLSNFAKHDTLEQLILLCKTHYFKRFREGGAYLGGEKFDKKPERDVKALAKTGDLSSHEPVPSVPSDSASHTVPSEPEPEPEPEPKAEPGPEPEPEPEPEPVKVELSEEEPQADAGEEGPQE